MSSIITNTILTNYPIAGVDNDSQGFRDNFLRIKTALEQAKAELGVFESRAVLKGTIADPDVHVENNLNGSSITNGSYNKLYGTSYSGSVTNDVITVDLHGGISQKFVIAVTNSTLTFTNWPAAGQYASVKVHITVTPTNQTGAEIKYFTSQNNGTVIRDTAFPIPLIANTGSYVVVEAWTQDGGSTVFIRYLGKYIIP